MSDKFIFALVLLAFFLFGFEVSQLIRLERLNRVVDGFIIQDTNWSYAKEMGREVDKNGDWVCVNVHKMSYDRAVEVCQHEVGHEIFAEECEKHFDKCLEVMNEP